MAELKHNVGSPSRLLVTGFHGITAVAELKRINGVKPLAVVQVSTASQPWPN